MKRAGREKTIVKLMGVVIFIGLLSEMGDRYFEMKKNLEREIAGKNSEILSYMDSLKGESPEKYLEQVSRLDDELFQAREKVMELPTEAEASLVVRQTISESAERTGVTLNSISSRKSKKINEEIELKELRTYFGYDSELEDLLKFFASFEDKPYYMIIDSLSISARQKPRRKNTKRKPRRRNIPRRKPLNGNAVLSTLYLPNKDGSMEFYEVAVTGTPTAGNTSPSGEETVPDKMETSPNEKETASRLPDDSEATKVTLNTPKPPREEPSKGENKALENKAEQLPSTSLQPKPKPLTDTAKPKKKDQTRF